MALRDTDNRPVNTSELRKEHAAPTLTGIRTIWTDSVASGLTPQRLARLLQSAVEGDHESLISRQGSIAFSR